MNSSSSHPGARARLQAVGDFFATQRHLLAVRDGVVGALPLVLVGSLFLLVAQPPWPSWQAAVAPYAQTLLVPYRLLGGAVALYVTFSAAHSLAKSYQLDAAACGLLALAAYLLAAYPNPPLNPPALPLARLGAGGIFAGLLLALGTVEITRLFVAKRWTLRLPPSVPDPVVRSFVALLPASAVIIAVFLLTKVARVDLIHLLELAAQPLLSATGSLPAALGIVGVDSGLWLLGVHASAALATLKPLWETMLLQNADAVAQGIALPHVAPLPFFLWFVWQGGSGATLALALLLCRTRAPQLRTVGRAGLLPALCNLSEPVLFGAPVVLNPLLAVPFLLAPLLCSATAYLALNLGWVNRPYLELPWTLPAPLGAFLSTGGDVRALFLQLFNLGLALAVYFPFVRRYDQKLCAEVPEVKLAPPSGVRLEGEAKLP